MSDFLYPNKTDKTDKTNKTNKLRNSADTKFHSDTDGIVDCTYNSTANSKLVKDDLTKYNTLRKYLQAHLHHSLNVSPAIITMKHLDKVFDQNIFNFSNYMAPRQKTSSIEIANILLRSLTQDWLDLPIEQAFPYSQSNCTGISFYFMPRKQQNYVFYDLRQTTQIL